MHVLIPPVNSSFPGVEAEQLGERRLALYSPQLPPHPGLSPHTPPWAGASALPLPAQHQLRAGERLKGIRFAGLGKWEGGMRERAVLVQSTLQTAHIWVIWRTKKGVRRETAAQAAVGWGAVGGGRTAVHLLNTDSTCDVEV